LQQSLTGGIWQVRLADHDTIVATSRQLDRAPPAVCKFDRIPPSSRELDKSLPERDVIVDEQQTRHGCLSQHAEIAIGGYSGLRTQAIADLNYCSMCQKASHARSSRYIRKQRRSTRETVGCDRRDSDMCMFVRERLCGRR